ncbi:MAG: type VI secretion system protein [Variovorax sp.]
MALTLDRFPSSLPVQFWLLALGCAVGFALLWWWTLGHRRWQRRRLLQRRLAELGRGAADSPPTAQPLASTARGTSDVLHPRLLFVGDAAANVAGLLQAGGALPQKETASAPWQAWTQSAMTAIALGPGIAEDAEDSRARSLWLQGLLTLAEQRPALPLNGVVVCVAAQALTQAPRGLAPLVQEAAQLLQLQLPVYVVITGLERFEGYAEVCAGLQPEVLAQALGHRLVEPDAGSGSAARRLDALFTPLSARLEALGMALVRDRPDPAARLAILRWVEQVVALQAGLAAVVDQLFVPGGSARWRGLYLTAAASETGQGAFAEDLFLRFLPDDQSLARPARHLR